MLSDSFLKLIAPILSKYEVRHASLFGSYARGEARPESDLDILVELPDDKSLLDLVGLKLDLEEAVGLSVDVVTYDALHPRIRETVLKDQVVIL